MMYQFYQAQTDMIEPFRAMARFAVDRFGYFKDEGYDDAVTRRISAAFDLFGRATLRHRRPSYDIDSVRIGTQDVPITEEAADIMPFCTLLHFRKAFAPPQPRVLLVAPLSG